MAKFNIVRYQITSTYAFFPAFQAGRKVLVLWDDAIDDFEVQLLNSDNTFNQVVSPWNTAPNPLDNAFVEIWYDYKFCDGTTLVSFTDATTPTHWFPYATKIQTLNHNACQISACDLSINSVDVVNASAPGTGDGQVTINAASSNGPIKYAIGDFDYATGGQVSNVFAGLYSGTYDIWIKDSLGCIKRASAIVTITENYGVKYRLDYYDLNHVLSRVDIEERDYSGPVIEVDGGGSSPFQLSWRREGSVDKFYPITSTEATITLNSKTNFEFLDLFTQDERKYRVMHYKKPSDDFLLRWKGFVTPDYYEEDYTITHDYPVTITASDGLGTLKEFDFLDASGNLFKEPNTILFFVCTILQKLDININIHEAINIYETTMDSSSVDSPLTQSYIDPSIYYDKSTLEAKKCDEVLMNLLLPYCARIAQSEGVWWITFIEDLTTDFDYRIFSPNGGVLGSGTKSPIIEAKRKTSPNRITYAEESGRMSVLPAFGKLKIVNDLGLVNNLLKTGTFELYNLVPGPPPTFDGWTIDASSGAGVTYGYEELKDASSDNEGAFFVDFSNAAAGAFIILKAEPFNIIADATVSFGQGKYFKVTFSFDLYLRVIDKAIPWASLQYSLKHNGQYYGGTFPSGDIWNPSVAYKYQGYYTNTYYSRENFSVDLYFPAGSADPSVEFEMKLSGNKLFDYDNFIDLRSVVTNGQFNIKRIVKDTVDSAPVARFYELKISDAAESLPEVVRGLDFNAATNQKVWRLIETVPMEKPDGNWIDDLLLDNVVLKVTEVSAVPYGGVGLVYTEKAPDATVTYEAQLNTNVKNPLEVPMLHGDVPYRTSPITGDPVSDVEERIYDGFMRLPSGIPTRKWSRKSISESRPLLEIAKLVYQGQVQKTSWKLSGRADHDNLLSFINSFHDTHNDKYYIPAALTLDDRNAIFDFEFLEMITGEGGAPPADLSAFSKGFSLGFKA